MSDTQAQNAPSLLRAQQKAIWLAILVAVTFFMENLDGTVIATATPAMAKAFAVHPVDLNIGVSAYLLTLGVFIPLSGWVAQRFGARKVFSAAIIIFTLASLLCGLVNSLWVFVAVRIAQGIGGAMMVPVGRLVVLRSTPKERLIEAIALLTWPALIAPVLGPAIGGFLATYLSWRWIFFLNLPVGLLALLGALWLVPNEPGHKALPFDARGFILTSGAIFLLMTAIEFISQQHVDWLMACALFALGGLVLVLSVRHLRHAAHPLIALDALKIPTFAAPIAGGTLFRMGVNAVPFLLPLMFQLGFGLSALDAGVLVIGVFAGNLVMKPFTTPLLRRFGFRNVMIVNGLINATIIAACATITAQTPTVLTLVILFISGLTRSMQFTALNTLAFADIEDAGKSAANTLFSAAFQLSMGLGIALGAVSIRLGEWALPTATTAAAPYHFAFLIVALVSLVSLADIIKLAPDAGRHLARKSGAA